MKKNLGTYSLTLDESPVSKRIIKSGLYEAKETALIKKVMKPRDIFIDVGAYIGYYTVMVSKIIGSGGKVFSFEPARDNFKLLTRNIIDNNCKNVCSYNMALGKPNGEMEQDFYLNPNNSGDHKLYRDSAIEEKTTVAVLPFDDILKVPELCDWIKLIKIDTQGAEIGVLSGMGKTIQRHKKLIIMVEFYPYGLIKMNEHPDTLIKMLWNLGFTIYDIRNNLKRINDIHFYSNYIGQKFTNLWCVKK